MHPRNRLRSRRGPADDGAALVEFALVAPVLVLIVFGLIEFGMALNDYQSIRNGVREGARQAVVQQYGSAGTSCTSIAAPDEVKEVICVTKDRIGLGDDVAVRVEYFPVVDEDDATDHGSVLVCAQQNVDSITNIVPGIDGISLESSILMKMEKPISAGISTSSPYEEAAPSGQDWSGC
ncbi:MAG: TadE family protein [Acidimicrobiales bacterium]|nr:TadE family protein [Acidimicrobiales bacterium]